MHQIFNVRSRASVDRGEQLFCDRQKVAHITKSIMRYECRILFIIDQNRRSELRPYLISGGTTRCLYTTYIYGLYCLVRRALRAHYD